MPDAPHALDTALRILVVDDEMRIRRALKHCLERDGHTLTSVANADAARQAMHDGAYHVVFLDLRLGAESGLDLIPELLDLHADLSIIVITAHATIGTAVEAMRRGASDYLPKPFTPEQVRLALQKAVDRQALHHRVALLESDLERSAPSRLTSSESPAMQAVLDEARQIADSEATVLIQGESGTGKGVLARAIHAWSPRADGPFGVVHSPSLSRELFESELFGHVKGAFTGATQSKPGRITQSDGGTLFLDEIAELPLSLQPKLLRFVQHQAYERVGDPETLHANVRLITATNADLRAEVDAGTFRQDLYYRLNVVPLTVPPLRERPADIIPLAERFLRFYANKYNQSIEALSEPVEHTLQAHAWPGNVRELENAIERAVILCRGRTLNVPHLPFADDERSSVGSEPTGLRTLAEVEADYIQHAIQHTDTLQDAARVLDIDPATLYRKRKAYGLDA